MKDFNTSLGKWLQENHNDMSKSAEMRADIHETILDMEISNEVTSQQSKLITDVLRSFITLYHICDRNPNSFNALLEILNPNKKDD